jgi:hypothetical protein
MRLRHNDMPAFTERYVQYCDCYSASMHNDVQRHLAIEAFRTGRGEKDCLQMRRRLTLPMSRPKVPELRFSRQARRCQKDYCTPA